MLFFPVFCIQPASAFTTAQDVVFVHCIVFLRCPPMCGWRSAPVAVMIPVHGVLSRKERLAALCANHQACAPSQCGDELKPDRPENSRAACEFYFEDA